VEIPGDVWKPFIGLVQQGGALLNATQVLFTPSGRLLPWKMSRMNLDIESDGVPTPNNAVPGYKSGISAKSGTTGKLEQACFDPLFNIYGVNPFVAVGGVGFTIALKQGMYIRMLVSPDHTVAGPLGLGDWVGVPILGTAGELLAALPTYSYIFLAMRVTKIHHAADAAQGQPFDFEFETVYPFALPGESVGNGSILAAYGFSATVGVGGFL
jgi:hypothetical protein